MKTIYLTAAALLLASSAAHAGSSIGLNFDGHKVRLNVPSNCQSLSCLQVTGLEGIKLKGLNTGSNDDDSSTTSNQPATPTAVAPVAAAPTAVPAPAPVAPTSVAPAPAPQVATTTAPQSGGVDLPPPAPNAVNIASTTSDTSYPAPAPAPAPALAPPPAPLPAPVSQPAPAPVAAAPGPVTPVGIWATEDNKGNVRIEQCGDNLCGYAQKTGEKILINMKPKDNKWVGRIHDPEGNSNYDSTIALKGPDTLKVQGCALGGLFCGGQTWKRVG